MTSEITRRSTVLGIGAGLALAGGALPALAQAAPATDTLARAQAVLALLSAEQREAASFSFRSATRQRWNYFGARPKPGLQLADMTPDQKEAALALLASILSPEGFAKAERVMILQDVLREQGRGSSRSRDRFALALFGTPLAVGFWGFRVEGHHLSIGATLQGDKIVSVTPSSFSSNPNAVNGTAWDGLVALQEEEVLGRRLFADLSASAARHALIRERAFGNILATAGEEDDVAARNEGVPLADLTQSQRDLALRIVEVYSTDHLAAPLAEEERLRQGRNDAAALRFGWAGGSGPEDTIYYRLSGGTVLIEFASLRRQPLHLHTIRHDPVHNLGRHLVT